MLPVLEEQGTSAGWMELYCLASGQETIQWVILSFWIDITMQTGNKTSSSKPCILHSFVYHRGLMQKTMLRLMRELDAGELSA